MTIPQGGILRSRRFLPLFVTQFLGAFNDNVFKNALVMLITFKVASDNVEQVQMMVIAAGALFIFPFFLFSALAGQLADKFDRSRIARLTKVWEMILVVIASAGFYLGSAYFLLAVLFCLGIQATFFGPVKYALLPQHLQENELIEGNAYIEAGTFLAILLGTICGGVLIMLSGGTHLIAAMMVVVALGGYISSRFIPAAPAPSSSLHINWNVLSSTWKMVQHDRKNRRVFRAILGISWFWLMGATYLAQFPSFAKEVLHGGEHIVTLFLTVFSIGIGIGSFLCNHLLAGKVSSRFVPIAALGISLFTADLYFAADGIAASESGELLGLAAFLSQVGAWRILADLTMVAVCSGLFIVPLYAIMQHDSDPEFRARTIATNNIINALFMVLSALVTMALIAASFSIPEIFLTIAALNLFVAIYIRGIVKAIPPE